MGGLISKLGNKNEDEEEEQKIRKYEEQMDKNPYGYGLQDTEDLKKIKWWQYLLFDLRFRIGYALILAIILGILIPFLLYNSLYKNSDTTIYGSCLINPDARFQCLVNNANPATRQSCVKAKCCWEENDTLPFKCFHSFPSSSQYSVLRVSEVSGNGTEDFWIQIDATPNDETEMSRLTIWIKWVNQDHHLNLQIFNPDDYPDRRIMNQKVLINNEKKSFERNGIIVGYGEDDPEKNYFFIQLVRNGTNGNETIFDTRLGPISRKVKEPSGFIFTTTLPTPYFYGLKGGEGISSKGTVTYGVLNGFENSELPFYMALEDSNMWHGVLLDTTLPFITQILQAPGIGWNIEGPKAEANLHLFLGPTQNDVLSQLYTHLGNKIKAEDVNAPNNVYIPPYWGLGLHLCRTSENASFAYDQIKEMNEILDENTGDRRIVYDSDCISENLRNPFGIDYENFPLEDITELADYLTNNASKKIVLSQNRIAIPYWENETDISKIEAYLIMDKTNTSNIQPFVGMIDNQTVIYPDMFHPNIFNNISLWGFDFGNISFSGLVLVDNYPKNEHSIQSCKTPAGSYLQKLLLNSSISSVTDIVSPWGSLCPSLQHNLGESREKTHLELHNLHGLQTLKKMREAVVAAKNSDFLLSASSSWTESLYYGAKIGMEVGFSWIGLRESLYSILSQFILSPVTGTQVCGTLPNGSSVLDDMTLCLRWYQLALVLPYVHHRYDYGLSPLDFPQRYQGYLRQAVRQRYAYAPYYYTQLITYQQNFMPMLRPMSFEFYDKVPRDIIFKVLDQFMIGEAILVAPVVKSELNRETFFPPGIWYDTDGYIAWDDARSWGFKTVTGHLTQTPTFIRGGYIIPTLENPLGNSILESRQGNYTLLVALLKTGVSTGRLLWDSGNNETNVYHEINFKTSSQRTGQDELEINTTISVLDAVCDDVKYSTTIDQIKLIGFPVALTNISIIYQENPDINLPYIVGDELDYLRIFDINMNWCEQSEISINVHASRPR